MTNPTRGSTETAAGACEAWPVSALVPLRPEPVEDFAERLVRRFLDLCENPRTRQRMLRLVKRSVDSRGAGRHLHRVVNRIVLSRVTGPLRLDTSAIRMELVASQLIGIAMMRYVLEVEPVASLPVDEVVRRMGPAVRAVLEA